MRLPTWRSLSQTLAGINLPPQAVNGLFRALCLLTPVVLFLCFFNPYVLDPTRLRWVLQNDWGQHSNGWNAYRHAADSFNHQSILANPMGNTLISTDSNPPFAFLFKLLSGLLPQNFQYIGLWFGFCVAMHVVFAYKLVRPHAPNRWFALGGAVALSALPALYYRMRHDTLVAQWLILWALHLFINVTDDRNADFSLRPLWRVPLDWFKGGAKMLGYTALMFFTGLLHPYMLFMVAAIWGGDVLKRFWPAARRLDRAVVLDTVGRAVFVLAAAILALFLAGTFTKGMRPDAGGWAYYSMGLDAFFNPVDPSFSTFLKAWPLNGGQSFEGYQYLGFGLLTLIVAAAVLYMSTAEAKAAKAFFGKLTYLALPFLILFLLAVTNRGMFHGYTLWNFPTPDALRQPLAVLRASGRFGWPIAYAMVLTALVVLFKSRPRIAAVLLPAILVLQAVDLSGFAAAMRKATVEAENPVDYDQTPSPLWDKLVAASSGVDFYPANVHFNDKLFYEVTWRATSQARPVNTMYAARENMIQVAYQDQGMDDFKRGLVNDNHLLVFLKQCDAPPAIRQRLRMLDGVWIIPPDAARDLPLDEPVWDPIRSDVRFGWLDQGTCMLDENWSHPDTEGVWSEGPEANVVIPIRHIQFDTPRPRKLDLNLKARSRVPARVSVVINGVKVGEIELTRRATQHAIHLPRWAVRAEALKIRFVVEAPLEEDIPAAESSSSSSASASRGAGRSTGGRGQVIRQTPEPMEASALGIKLIDIKLVDPDAPVAPPPLKG
ncbi:MAG: hypothetical protein JF615_02135 [Asticcacaulis sp.]|nr:hypothetical protein [Asticcacaulis sp.]